MVTSTKPTLRAQERPSSYRGASFEVAFFCKACKGHYTSEYQPALGRPLRCRCGATNVVVYGAVRM